MVISNLAVNDVGIEVVIFERIESSHLTKKDCDNYLDTYSYFLRRNLLSWMILTCMQFTNFLLPFKSYYFNFNVNGWVAWEWSWHETIGRSFYLKQFTIEMNIIKFPEILFIAQLNFQ